MKIALQLFMTRTAAAQKYQSRQTLSRVFFLLIGLAMNSLTPTIAEAVEHIQVTREILLEKGTPVTPYAMAQTKNGDYVIVGAFADNTAWATRVDANGNVQWRHSNQPGNFLPGEGESKYESVVILADDSALLCGWRQLNREILGLITHIDKTGKVLSERTLLPQGDENFRLNYLKKCVAWGDGFAAVGIAYRPDIGEEKTAESKEENFSWLLTLDAQANTKWEKMLPAINGLGIDVLVMPNQDLIGSAIRISPNGDIEPLKAVRKIRQIIAQSSAHASSNEKSASWSVETRLRTKEEEQQIKGESDLTRSNAEYFLPDNALVEFGARIDRGTDTAAISWLSATSTETQTFTFQPFWKARQVNAAIPTGRPGEFVTVRQAVPWTRPPDPEHFGVVLAFIQVK